MMVHFHIDVQNRAELVNVCFTSGAAEHALGCKSVEFGYVAGEDFVSRGETGIGCDYSVVWARDGKGCTAVKVVGGECTFIGGLRDTVIDGVVIIFVVRIFREMHGDTCVSLRGVEREACGTIS